MTALGGWRPAVVHGLKAVALAIAMAGAAGCASTAVIGSHFERDLDFGRYRTFAWGPADALPIADPRLDGDPVFRDHVQGAVEKGLAARDLTLAAAAGADLLVHYHASSTRRLAVNRAEVGAGYCSPEDCPAAVVEFEAGTLVLDLIDTRSNRLIWRGWARTALADLLHPDRMARTVREAVARALERLPAGLKK